MSNPVARLNAALEGCYAIERELGEGGMATVYLADDIKHNRKVALKVLKPELAAVVGAERFLAEIQVTANLQHPHILPLFDSGEADGFLFYVMPYVEGDTLKDRLDREHQLPVGDAVQIATDMAEALDYAHRQGVIHRDIKPGNVLLQAGKPVISDFGIALAVGVAGRGRLTETGLSLGTPHYMSPEQATGDQTVGASTDTYALGSVLYEMLVGEPPYPGTTAQAVLGKIIAGKPVSVMEHRSSVPANVDAAVRCALEKLPADRFGSVQEFVRALEDEHFRYGELATVGADVGVGPWKRLSIGLAGLATVLTLTLSWSLLRSEPPQPVSRQVLSTEGWLLGLQAPLGRIAALAPDGSSMVLPIGSGIADRQLALKMRGSTEITPIPGTEQALEVVYSPDAQWIAYHVGADVLKRPLVGGAPVTLAEDANPSGVTALAWLDDGSILYEAQDMSSDVLRWIARISEDGEPLGIVFGLEEQVAPAWARGLPDARGALVIGCPGTATCTANNANLYVVDLDDLSWEIALEQVMRAWYAPTGHVVYVRADGAVFAQPFDAADLELTGSVIPLFDGVRVPGTYADMLLGADGTLLYVEGQGAALDGTTPLWLGRDGSEEMLDPALTGLFEAPAFSPDGRKLALQRQIRGEPEDIWIYDLEQGTSTRLTFGGSRNLGPFWNPDGTEVGFSSDRDGLFALYSRPADLSGDARLLVSDPNDGLYTGSWTPDGRSLVYRWGSAATTGTRDLWYSGPDPDSTPVVILGTPALENTPSLSPDGRWLAYASDESGQFEVYVRPFPGPGGQTVVSVNGGLNPRWAHSGSEIFYLGLDAVFNVATVRTDPDFAVDSRERLNSRTVFWQSSQRHWDLTPDGQRLLAIGPRPEAEVESLGRFIIVQNFFEELRQRAPN